MTVRARFQAIAARCRRRSGRVALWGLLLGASPTAAVRAATPPVGGSTTAPTADSHWIYSVLPKSLQKNPRLDLTVITEMTEAGRKLPEVSPARPAYFQFHSTGLRQLGDVAAGSQPLAPENLEALLLRSLAARGYLPANGSDNAPSLVLVYGWGAHNLLREGDDDNPVYDGAQVARNVLDRAALVGGAKFAEQLRTLFHEADALAVAANASLATDGTPPISPGLLAFAHPVNLFKLKDPKNAFLVNQTAGDVYYVVVSAYDYRSVAANNRILLWRTRMTVAAQGISQAVGLPVLVQSASAYFGKEMAAPEILFRRSLRAGSVEVGVPTVVEPPAESPPLRK